MNLLIIGATGGVGQQLVAQGLDAGHGITAFVRSPEKLEASVEAIKGDVRDAASVAAAFASRSYDAVIFSVGAGSLSKDDVRAVGTGHVIAAMQQHTPNALLVIVSSLLTGDSKQQMGIPARWLVGWILRHPIADHEAQEKQVFASDLPYLIVRPGGLSDEALTGQYTVSQPPESVPANGSIPRADVAHFILSALDKPEHRNQAITLTPA